MAARKTIPGIIQKKRVGRVDAPGARAGAARAGKQGATLAAKMLRRRIGAMGGREFVPYGESFNYAEEIETILDEIEQQLLPGDPGTALELLAQFIASDEDVFERADDSSGTLGMVFTRAAELFAVAGRRLKDPERCLELLLRLLEKDDYGVRGDLLGHLSRFLRKPQIGRFLEN
nr:hypothetical protein [Verrucomicrobiota bacterium]